MATKQTKEEIVPEREREGEGERASKILFASVKKSTRLDRIYACPSYFGTPLGHKHINRNSHYSETNSNNQQDIAWLSE